MRIRSSADAGLETCEIPLFAGHIEGLLPEDRWHDCHLHHRAGDREAVEVADQVIIAAIGESCLRARELKQVRLACHRRGDAGDRKSTRLNSSHSQISYAVFCLKKKN